MYFSFLFFSLPLNESGTSERRTDFFWHLVRGSAWMRVVSRLSHKKHDEKSEKPNRVFFSFFVKRERMKKTHKKRQKLNECREWKMMNGVNKHQNRGRAEIFSESQKRIIKEINAI